MKVDETLRQILEGTSASIGDEFFRALARSLAGALNVRYCFIAECADHEKSVARTLAFFASGDFAENMEYPLSGTPCEGVVLGDICCYPAELQKLFPQDQALVAMAAQSYAGVPLRNVGGVVLGHLVVMDDKPRVFDAQETTVLQIFATRACAELERMRAEQAQTKSEERLRTLLDINNAIVSRLTRDELFRAICDSLGRIVRYDRIALALQEAESDSLRVTAIAGPMQTDYSPVGHIHNLRDSQMGWAVLHQRPLLRRDLEREREFSAEHRAFERGFRSLCALPLIVRGKSIGAITVASLNRLQYTEADAAFLMEVAKQIAIAIDNMRSYEEIADLKARLQAENVYLQEEIKTEHNFEEIIGQSPPMRQLLSKLEQVAPTEATVLIQGETGTGKELLARAVHDRSGRKDRPLVKVNCGSIPSGLVESELFGHEKGAFTGATQRRVGRFELAHGGTIFLDEVSELPVDTQVKLLRVLQEGEFERVGSSQTLKVDARVIAATNRDLKELVDRGAFRDDLFYRLNVFPLEAPPLRERKGDIPLLIAFFLSKFAKRLGKQVQGVTQRSMETLVNYSWPGNVRELQNVIERAVILARGPVAQIDHSMLRVEDLPESSDIDTLENVERHHIIRALNETDWIIHGKKGAAELLAINPSTLRSRIEKLGIKRPAPEHR